MAWSKEARVRHFWQKVCRVSDDSCWLWCGGVKSNGYGRWSRWYAHRFAYELCVGPIPKDLTIDHLCRQRSCVNPAHMEIVTRGENVLRGFGPSAKNKRMTTCVQGHILLQRGKGKRRCRICLAFWRRENESLTRRSTAESPIPGKYHFLTPFPTHCKRGHEYTPENTLSYPRWSGRQCRTCHNARRRTKTS